MAVAGLMVVRESLLHSGMIDLGKFLAFLTIAMVASGFKVRLPGIEGTMSVSFLFILIGVIQLSLGETLVIAFAAAGVQSFWQRKRDPKLVQVAFNFSMIAAAVGLSYFVYQYMTSTGHGLAISLLAVATTYFLSNTLPVAMIIAMTEGKSFFLVWVECYFWSFPHYLVGASVAGLLGVITREASWEKAILVLPFAYVLFHSCRVYLDRLEAGRKHVEDMAGLHLRTIEALALAIEAKDQTTHDHLHRVRTYAVEIGKMLKLSDDELEALRAAALLHDIGKLAVPEPILNKPGRLTPEEFEKMKIHPLVGAEILRRVNFPYPVVPVVEAHHERWDGMGYPFGLSGEEIPIGARILSAVDCLDALASDRQYRRALPLHKAVEEIVSLSGRQFDPKVIETLKANYPMLERKAIAEMAADKSSKLSLGQLRVDVDVKPAAGYESTEPAPVLNDSSFLESIAAARHEAQTLFELSSEMNSLSLDETLSLLAVRLRRLVPYDSIAIYVREENQLVPRHISGEHYRLLSTLQIPVGQGISGWVAQTGTPIVNGNPALESASAPERGRFAALGSALAVPLTGVSGTVGVLTLYQSQPNAFTRDHLRILLAISSKVAMSMENALRFQQAENSATTDFLTGLPNARSLFLHLDGELSRCKREQATVAVMVCDLDGFKEINDRYGHLEGNNLLRAFAQSLKQACREYDYVARMGGDEFVLVAPGLVPGAANDKVQRLHQMAVDAAMSVCGDSTLSVSVGCAFFAQDGTDAEQLLAVADQRMYVEKQKHHQAHPVTVQFHVPPARFDQVN